MSAKFHMLCDAMGRPLNLLFTGGQVIDCAQAEEFIQGVQTKAVLTDKGNDTDAIRHTLINARIEAVIPPKSNRKKPIKYDRELYKQRNLIEHCFGKLKLSRRVATRFDRNESHYRAYVYIAAALIWILNVDWP